MTLTFDGPVVAYGAAEPWLRIVLDWSNTYLAFPLGVVGFGFALWQIIEAKRAANRAEVTAGEAKTAADAARAASEQARGQFKVMSVAAMLPQLQRLEHAIERAILDRSLNHLLHLLQDWRWHASARREYLDDSVEAQEAVMKDIQSSLTAAGRLKHRLPTFNGDTDWAKDTGPLRKSLAQVTENLGAVSAQQTLKEPS